MKRRFFSFDGGKLSYYDFGSGESILLLHGFASDADFLLPLGKLLEKRYRVIIPDLPGFGLSKTLPKNSAENIAVVIGDLLRHLNIKKTNFFGVSLGSAVLLHIGLDNPDLIGKVFLNAPLWRKDGLNKNPLEKLELFLVKLPLPLLSFLRQRTFIKLILSWVLTIKPIVREELKGWYDVVVHNLINFDVRAAKELFMSVWNDKLYRRLGKESWTCPTILIGGTADDVILEPEIKKLAKLLNTDKIFMLEGATHEAIIQMPEKLAKIILDSH